MKNRNCQVYWITGLSGSGKTTLATQMVDQLCVLGLPSVLLDGDELRVALAGTDAEGFSRDDRLSLGLRYAKLSQILASQGVSVVVATISMFDDVYKWNRENVELYTEIFLDVPMAELQRRDSKGLYGQDPEGLGGEVAGVGVSVDPPQDPTIHLIWRSGETPESMFFRLGEELSRIGVIELGVAP